MSIAAAAAAAKHSTFASWTAAAAACLLPQRRRRPAARTTEGSHPHPILMLPYSIAEILNKYSSYGGWDQKK